MAWFDVSEATMVWAPIGTTVNKSGEERPRFSRLGVKVKMDDGCWWFYSFKHGSYTQHFPRVKKFWTAGLDESTHLPEKTNRYASWSAVEKEFKNRPHFLESLQNAINGVLEQVP